VGQVHGQAAHINPGRHRDSCAAGLRG
jgi:hypothetical protein